MNLFEQIYELNRAGESFAVATVVRVEKPISARPGDKAIITADGSLQGWVGGGCAQNVVIREAQKAIRDTQPRFLRLIGSGATSSSASEGVLEFPITCHSGGTMDVYLEPVLPRPQLILFGASPVAVTLAKLARVLDFEVAVFDPEIERDHFPDADFVSTELDLAQIRIHPIAFVVVTTQGHDDEAALEIAARSGVPYVAFVASRKKFASSAAYLRERRVSDEQVARIKAPAGLDLGAVTPEEIAASILAEIIQRRRQRDARPGAPPAPAATAGTIAAGAEARDIVCGMVVEIATARHVADSGGERFYFCCSGCQRQFEKNPTAFITDASDRLPPHSPTV